MECVLLTREHQPLAVGFVNLVKGRGVGFTVIMGFPPCSDALGCPQPLEVLEKGRVRVFGGPFLGLARDVEAIYRINTGYIQRSLRHKVEGGSAFADVHTQVQVERRLWRGSCNKWVTSGKGWRPAGCLGSALTCDH